MSSGYKTLQPTVTIICITDPSGANIYIDGVLQPITTSGPVTVYPGNHVVTFAKAGYTTYSQTVSGLKPGHTVNVCAILGNIANITSYGIVICTYSSTSSCPTIPLSCPILASPLNYVNFITIISSSASISLTVNFTYTLDSTTYIASVYVNLLSGINVVYAFPANIQYVPNTIMSLIGVTLS